MQEKKEFIRLSQVSYPKHFDKIICLLKRLPGVGTKSAERYAFALLKWNKEELKHLSEALVTIHEKLSHCQECGALCDAGLCPFCTEERASTHLLCIVSNPRDIFAVEQTHAYRGLYHVLGHLLSPLDDWGPEQIDLNHLKIRLKKHGIREVIIALDSTVEGDATALYLKDELRDVPLTLTRLAFGIPMGSSLDYVDGGTLARALSGRGNF